jgi:hypothetical protein
MPIEVAAQLHLWPWSIGVKEETFAITDKNKISFTFFGSPVLSVSTKADFFLAHRHEQFAPLGSHFKTAGGTYRVYESPHMDLTSSEVNPKYFSGLFRLCTPEKILLIHFSPQGARSRFESGGEKIESLLARSILAWSQFYDDILEETKSLEEHVDEFPWSAIYDFIKDIKTEVSQPRMALIVKISEIMHKQLPVTVASARRVLVRERQMISVSRLAETDTNCLRWYVRQPGEDMVEKASGNHQALLGVARRESFDTLENKVLKEFIHCCENESRRYIKNEVGDNDALKSTNRCKQIRKFKILCGELVSKPIFQNVSKLRPGSPSNYVLQNDIRYRKVWQNYRRILKKESEEDRIWDWQSRAWADVARLLVNVAFFDLYVKTNKNRSSLNIEELFESSIRLFREQHLGCRADPGSEPGPFFIWDAEQGRKTGVVLEIVHPSIMDKHATTRELGRIGGHLYIVLTPLIGGSKTVIVVWAIHTAGAKEVPLWEKIANSAKRALHNHEVIIGERAEESPNLKGLIIASDLNAASTEFDPGTSSGLPLFQVPVDQRCWEDAVEILQVLFEESISEVLAK